MHRNSQRLYSQNEVNRIFSHVNNRTLLVWAERGLVETAAENVDGRGRNRLYSRANLLQIALVERMTALNFNFENIKKIMGEYAFGLSDSGKDTVLEILDRDDNLLICWTLRDQKNKQPMMFTTEKWEVLGIRKTYEMEIILRLPVIAKNLEVLIKDADLKG
jgi:DNA-binding transcriptional MerR regulator